MQIIKICSTDIWFLKHLFFNFLNQFNKPDLLCKSSNFHLSTVHSDSMLSHYWSSLFKDYFIIFLTCKHTPMIAWSIQLTKMAYWNSVINQIFYFYLYTADRVVVTEGTPPYIPPLTYIVNKKIIKNPNEFSG